MASFDMESESYEIESRAFKRNSLFELYCAQKEAARFLKLAYLALKKDPKFALKVHKIAYDALNQHLKTQSLMIGFEDTAIYVVESLMPRLKKELEEKKVNPFKKILEEVLGYVNRMIKETKDAVNRDFALREAVYNLITDIFNKVKSMKIDEEMNQKKLQELLLSSKDEYDDLQVKTKELAEEIKDSKKKRHDFLHKSANEIDQASLYRACRELGEVGGHFWKKVMFWNDFAEKLNTLIEGKECIEILLEFIDDEDLKEHLDESTNDITKVWSSFRMVCAYYINKNDREILDLYSFLSESVDQLSTEH